MAHTPGPWQFYELTLRGGTPDGLGYIRPADEDGREIAHHGDMERPVEENRANGHLIAAAPDLLAACKAQHKALDILFAMLIARSPIGEPFQPSKSGEPWDAMLAGLAAITKAQGTP